jgi:hypothetical protein
MELPLYTIRDNVAKLFQVVGFLSMVSSDPDVTFLIGYRLTHI